MGDRNVTTVKQLCLGVAVAGVVAGAGSAVATGVAYAEPTSSGSSSSDSSSSDSTSSDSASSDSASSGSASSDSASSGSASSGGYTGSEARAAKKAADKKAAEDTAADAGADPDTDTSGDSASTPSSSTSPASENNDDSATAGTTTASTGTASEKNGADPAPRRFGVRHQEKAQTRDQVSVRPEPAAVETSTPASQPAPAPQAITSLKPTKTPPIPFIPAPLVPATPAGATAVGVSSSSTTRKNATTADVAAQIVDPTKQHVLVIGVDGTNLTRVLDDPGNANFFELMDTGVTGPTTIVGHTTISNPSWTAILTGVWDNKSGVINNMFTPQTYNSWPTVFNQLEAYNSNINTKVIADWQVIADIGGAGSHPADQVVYIPQGADDPLYAEADAAVTAETVDSILGTSPGYENVPNFLFTYMTQVDEAGHQFGGASPEYAAAIARTNTNVGAILDAVAAREAASCAAGACEDWTIIMVTDHGHQPQQGFGHGFQSPDETASFVIVDGPDFGDGQMNLKYSIVDITPTVVSLFGGTPTVDADGVPLTDHQSSVVDPVDLHQAVNDVFDRYGWPDIQTNVALSLRTIFATIPYYVDTFTTDTVDQLNAIAGQGIFLVSDLAAIAVFPVEFIGDAVYALTNAIAQVVARLTGAGVIPPSSSAERDGQPYPYALWA